MKKPLKDSPNVGYLIYSSTYFYHCQQTNVVSLSAEVGLRYSVSIPYAFSGSLSLFTSNFNGLKTKQQIYILAKNTNPHKRFSV